MLKLNPDAENYQDAGASEWKLLVFDKLGQDIISPLIKVGDIRAHGVTMHM